MTTWDDLADDDELAVDALSRRPRSDDDEPYAAPAPTPAPADRGADDEAGGCADAHQTVRVWADETWTVTRVQVSTAWRDRGDGPLAARILQAAKDATLGRLYARDEVEVEERPAYPPYEGRLLSAEEIGLDALIEESLQLSAELDALHRRQDVRPQRVIHEEAVGHSANQKVMVALDENRRPSALQIEDRWLASARTEKIIDSVREAFGAAYAQWQEPVVEPGEYEEISARFEDLQRRTMRPLLQVGGWIDPGKDDR